ncbi:MAG: dual specificity protein phosphatase family protein [Chloroflexi bacterium]|nr:dual specificity protein phosphatase family protein [Chloroflexota bacterium]
MPRFIEAIRWDRGFLVAGKAYNMPNINQEKILDRGGKVPVNRGYIPHPKHIPFEYDQITDHIYVGTNQCCQAHFDDMLLKKGVAADISLEDDRLDAPFGVQYYLWLPVPDHTPPTYKQLLIGATMLKHLVDNDIRVYLHCKRGHGRSPTLVSAYFILEGMTASQAIRRVRERRLIHLRRTQIRALHDFERTLSSS